MVRGVEEDRLNIYAVYIRVLLIQRLDASLTVIPRLGLHDESGLTSARRAHDEPARRASFIV